jgi:flagellin-like hook-associated protein FlgL
MTTINTNHSALVAALYQRSSENVMQQKFERLSSGLRINRSSDDAAGLSFASKLNSQIRGMTMAMNNSLNGISLVKSATKSIEEIKNIVIRIDELAKQMANGIYGDTDRLNAQSEVSSLLLEIQRIANHTAFNDVKLLDGSLDTNIRAGNLNEELVNVAIRGMGILSFIEGVSKSIGVSKTILRPSLFSSVSTAFDVATASRGLLKTNTINVADFRTGIGTSVQNTPTATNAVGLSTISVLPSSNAVNGNSAFDTLSETSASGSSISVFDPGNQVASVVAQPVADGAADGSSILTSVEFSNGDFASTTATRDGDVVSIPGWNIHLEQVSLAPNTNPSITSTIGGFSTPSDTDNPLRAIGDDIVANTSYSYQIINGEVGLTVGNMSLASYVQIHGPYIISKGAVELEQGDQVSFDYFAQAGGDHYDAYGYLLNVNNGNTVELLNRTGASTQSISTAPALRNQTVSTTVNQAGNYKFVFVAGTFDATGGQYLGGSLWISNVDITQANPPAANETTGRVYVTAKEAVSGSDITVDSDLFTTLQTAAATDPDQPKNPDGTINPAGGRFSLEWNGSGPSPFTVDQYTGDVTASGLSYDAANPATNNYSFKVKYTGSAASNGLTHEETVNLEVTETLKASSTLSVQEASSQASVEITAMDKLNSFASRDNFQGTFQFANNSSTLAQNFNINQNTGKLTSKAGIEFDNFSPNPVNGNVVYIASDNRTFENAISLSVEDTFSANATVQAEQADVVRIDIQNRLASIYAFAQKDSGFNWNKFSISSLNGANSQFSVVSGEIVSNATASRPKMLIDDQQVYNFDLVYQKDPSTAFTETITLNLTESLQSSSHFSVFEALNSVVIQPGVSDKIYAFAQRDNFNGRFSFVNPTSGDADYFNIDSYNGKITSKTGVEFENFMAGSEQYNFLVKYTASDSRVFTDTLQLNIKDTLNANASLFSEQAHSVGINIQSQLTTSYSFANRNPNFSWNKFSIGSRNSGDSFFEIAQNRDLDGDGSIDNGYIVSRSSANRPSMLLDDQSNYDFDLIYQLDDGTQHVESINLDLTQSLQATATITALEANQVSFGGANLGEIHRFAKDDNFFGNFRFKTAAEIAADPSSTLDHNAFQINGSTINSIGALDFDTKASHEIDVLYTNRQGKTFTQRINLQLTDTFSATANLTVEEAAEVITNISSLSSYAFAQKELNRQNPGQSLTPNFNNFRLESANGDHLKMVIASNGDIVSIDEFRKSTQEFYNFDIVYSASGQTFREAARLQITDTTYNKSESLLTASEAEIIKIDNAKLANINAYAASDAYSGTFIIEPYSIDDTGYINFNVDEVGNVTSWMQITQLSSANSRKTDYYLRARLPCLPRTEPDLVSN